VNDDRGLVDARSVVLQVFEILHSVRRFTDAADGQAYGRLLDPPCGRLMYTCPVLLSPSRSAPSLPRIFVERKTAASQSGLKELKCVA
jgi:hypothetical protein